MGLAGAVRWTLLLQMMLMKMRLRLLLLLRLVWLSRLAMLPGLLLAGLVAGAERPPARPPAEHHLQ